MVMPLRAACAETFSSVLRDSSDEEPFGHEDYGLAAGDLGEPARDRFEVLDRPLRHHPRLADVEARLLLDQVLDVADPSFARAAGRVFLARLRAEGIGDFTRPIGDAVGVDLARNARPFDKGRRIAWRFSKAGCTARTPASSSPLSMVSLPLVHAAVEEDAAGVAVVDHVADEGLGAVLDAHQRVVREVRLVEQHHEHAMRAILRLVGVLAGQRIRGLPEVVGDHEELLDPLRLAVFQQGDVVDLQTRDEVAVLVEDDGVHFDEGGRGLERRLLPPGGARDADRQEERRGAHREACNSHYLAYLR